MKICIISFDFWNYDEHIAATLRKKGIEAHHINIGAYKHRNFSAKITNTFSKVFLQKNVKNEKRQQFILDELKMLGHQDQILIINPELIEEKFHVAIKKYTSRYIAYLYDSLARCPVGNILHLFDTIYSFEGADSKKYGFTKINNYNYLEKVKTDKNPEFDLVYLASYDERLKILYKITERLEKMGLTYQYVIVGKKSWKKNLLKMVSFKGENVSKKYQTRRINQKNIPQFYMKGNVLLDLVRENQSGLSFRIFEAMALGKKIISDNQSLRNYDFYKPENILILNKDLSNLNSMFFETLYEPLSDEIYKKYSLENWVETVFNLK
ncbi:glycosyltransferase family protein [Halpernia sp. GG3]